MTLVLTELTPLGIAMAADSAVTFTNLQTGESHAEPNRARKLQAIPYLNAGISCWGMGEISGISTDDWIEKFIKDNEAITSLMDFTDYLAKTLNTQLPSNTAGENRLGFHVAGYETYNGIATPSFYHVHDGPSATLAKRGVLVNPNQVNANHDVSPEIYQQSVDNGNIQLREMVIICYTLIFSIY